MWEIATNFLFRLFQVNVHLPEDPVTYAWEGGAALASSDQELLQRMSVSRQEYQERGHGACAEKYYL